jgi:hypothetical protein
VAQSEAAKTFGMQRRIHRLRNAVLASGAAALLAAPAALAAPIDGGDRNPSNNASTGYSSETQIIGEVAQNAGGHAAGTGGYVTRQSNKSDSGGGAIYGCRAKAGTESCVAANNLNNGDAFRFQATPSAGTIGQLRFGLDINKTIDKPPFVTNGTGLVKNLNADRLDGKSAEDFAEKASLGDYVAKGSLLFAAVGGDGKIGASRGLAANAAATVDTSGTDPVVTVPFTGDLSKCVATATPTGGTTTDRLIVGAPGTDGKVAITEQGATTPYGFSVQVTC